MTSAFDEAQAKIRECILSHVPKEAEITRIEFEGPRLAIYTKKPEVLIEQSFIVTDIVNLIRKRIVVRSDPSVRLSEVETENIIKKMAPPESEITNVTFDPTVGEVIIEAKKPGLVIGKNGDALQEIIKATKWRPRVLRTPPIPSKIIAHIRHYLHAEAKDRETILRSVGERIFRPIVLHNEGVRITTLGGFQQVGRSAILIRTQESSILLDCGLNPGSTNPVEAYPRLNVNEFDIENLDAVVVSHSHLDHCGFLPFLYKYGYDGPVYCSEPTSSLMTLLQLDYLDVLTKEGHTPPYDQKNVRDTVLHTIPIKYGIVTDIAPDMRLTIHNAGHILGSSIIHLHIGEGLHNVVYTGDYKYARTMLLEPAATMFPRVETLITECTYGALEDVMPARKEVEEHLITIVNQTVDGGGKVLIPVLAVGRAQEVMLILDSYMRTGLLREVPIFLEGMINEVTAIHTAYPEYLSRELRDQILHQDVNPFQSEYFTIVKSPDDRDGIVNGGPCVILATSGMLEGGPVLDYFRRLADNSRNTLIFVSYQIEGTLGRRVQHGLTEVSMINNEGKMEILKRAMRIESVEGLSGHSDRNQIINYIRRVVPKPECTIICHGERAKCIGLANALCKITRINSCAPENLETIKLR